MGVDLSNVRDVFTYHPPSANYERTRSYERLRAVGLELALAILEETPPCADQQAAIRKVREAVMTANASLALSGAV